MSHEPFRCSTSAELRAEPLLATASHVESWLLLEQPGAWGPNAVSESRLHFHVARALTAQTQHAGVRLVLIRRRDRVPSGARYAYAVHAGARSRFIERATVTDATDLLDVDLTPLARGEPVGLGAPQEEALFLVCTHGRHDVCCAVRGNPVAKALVRRYPEHAWECSHIGGDRFAANVVCFPHGIYYGRVDAAGAVKLAEDYERGRLDLEHFRGRCSYPRVVQAAEHFIRRDESLAGVDSLLLEASRTVRPGVVEVSFLRRDGARLAATVGVERDEREWRLTCRARGADRPQVFKPLFVGRL